MLANDIEKRLVRKALFVRADDFRRINAGENRRLSGRALRTTCYPETGVSGCENARKRQLNNFILENCQRIRGRQPGEGIMRTAGSDSQTINEEKQHARIIFHDSSR